VRNQKTEEIDPNFSIQTWHYTPIGVMDHHTDMQNASGYGSLSGTMYSYFYDSAGHLMEQTNTLGQDISYTYDIDGRLAQISDSGNTTSSLVQSADVLTTYTYDTSDRVTEETVEVDGKDQQDTISHYDADGRLESVSDLDDYQLTYAYDAAGNRTLIETSYQDHQNHQKLQTLYYRYNANDRVIISEGVATTGSVADLTITAAQGQVLTYDAKGQRITARSAGQKFAITNILQNGTHIGQSVVAQNTADGTATQQYVYDGLGRLKSVGQQADFYLHENATNTTTFVGTGFTDTDEKVYDKDSRVKTETNFTAATTGFDATATTSQCDDDGRVMSQTTTRNGQTQAVVTYGEANHNSGSWSLGFDPAGVLRAYAVTFYSGGTAQYTTTHNLSYELGGSYLQTRETVTSSGSGAPGPGGTTRIYNVNGALVQESDDNLPNNTRYFANDDTGHVLATIQGKYDGIGGDPTLSAAWDAALSRNTQTGAFDSQKAQYFFYAAGNYIGSFGQLTSSDGSFVANFDVNYTPVSSSYPASTPANVVVQSGDTLRTIAARIFGDANLWYLIAQANGLTDPNSAPAAGTTLIVPNKVVSLSNTSDSFKPFDLSQAIGDTTPYQPAPPPKDSGCGVFGQILEIAVAIVVTYFTAGALTGLAPVIAGAIGGVAGSVAGQVVAIADGDQKGFNWKSVAIGAIAGAVGGELGGSGFGKAIGQDLQLTGDALKYGATAINAAAGSVITQGISVITGLQQQFSWSSVATAAIAAPLVQAVDGHLGINTNPDTNTAADRFEASLVSTAANGVVSAAAQLAFGGKIQTVSLLANAFGQVLGNSFVSLDETTPTIAVSADQEKEALDQIAKGAAETADDVNARVKSDNAEYFASQEQADANAKLVIQQSADDLNASLARSMAELSRMPQINFPADPVDPVVAAEYAARGGNTVDFLAAQAQRSGSSMDHGSADSRTAEQESATGTIGPDTGLADHLYWIGKAWLHGDLSTGDAIGMALDNTGYAYKNSDTAQGAVQISGGVAEVAGAVGITAASGGTGAIVGVPLAFHGGDNIGTGINRILYGDPQNTFTYNAVDALTGSPTAARAVDTFIPLLGAVAGAAGAVDALSSATSAAATSETTGALTNLGDANAVTNGSMLNKFGPKPGFSGVYNPESGRFLAYPSGETVMADGSKPVNLVEQFGGHRAVNQTLSDLLDVNPRSNLGFSFVTESDGTVSIGFNSGSVNINSLAGNGTRTVPLQYQQPIADALQKAMGLKVVLPR